MIDPAALAVRIRTVQLVVAALALGVLIFTGVSVGLITAGVMGSGVSAGPTLPLFAALVAALLLALAPVLRRHIADPARAGDEDGFVTRWASATIVAAALREGAGLLGITVSMIVGSAMWALAFGVASLAAIGLGWPQADDLKRRIRKVESRL